MKSDIFRMFQLVYIVASPIVAMNLKNMGRKNSVVIGYFFMVSPPHYLTL
jgi:hypothetical protein